MSYVSEILDSMNEGADHDLDRLNDALAVLKTEALAMSNEARSRVYLKLAAQFLEEAAYSLVHTRKANEAVQLFALASNIERETERLSLIRDA